MRTNGRLTDRQKDREIGMTKLVTAFHNFSNNNELKNKNL